MDRPVRVCLPFVGDTVGGSHVSITQLLHQFHDEEVEPIVVLHRDGPLAGYLTAQNINFELASALAFVERAPLTKQVFAILKASALIAKFLRTRNIDIVHTNDSRMHMTWGVGARLTGTRFVWHQRSAEDSRRLDYYTRLAHEVLTISEYCRSIFPPGMARRANVLDNPFDTNAPLPDRTAAHAILRNEVGASQGAFIVGFVGNLASQKRPLVFIEMAARLTKKLGKVVFFPMFGAHRKDTACLIKKKISELELSDRCLLMGPRHPIEPWIAGCDILVAPAIAEGHGRTVVEAMLTGTLVVASDHGGHREIIGDRQVGMLVEIDNPDAFSQVVEALLVDHTKRSKITRQAREYAVNRFSRDRHMKAILSVYRRVLS